MKDDNARRRRSIFRRRSQSTVSWIPSRIVGRKANLQIVAQDGRCRRLGRLWQAFEHHRDEKEGHIERLEPTFELLGKSAHKKAVPSRAFSRRVRTSCTTTRFRRRTKRNARCRPGDRAIRYEITLKSWAAKLGMGRAVLDQTLSEERKTDETLSKIATTTVNVEAA